MKNSVKLILASKSPRRRQLLKKMDIPFRVEPASINEAFENDEQPRQLVQRLALQKAQVVAERYANVVILGADTVIALHGKIIGKPASPKEARAILRSLSDTNHEVFSGVALLKTDANSQIVQKELFFERTLVTFGNLSPSLIKSYIKSGELMDKAGAYGIQDKWGAAFVKRIEGDFYNVMGLPLYKLMIYLKKIEPKIFQP